MADIATLPEQSLSLADTTATARLLVSLGPLPPGALGEVLANLSAAFPGHIIDVATPDPAPPALPFSGLRVVSYTPQVAASGIWLLTAADFLNCHKLMKERGIACCLMLGPDAQSLAPHGLQALAAEIESAHADLVMPRYTLGARDGLVNSAILYPTTRALFGIGARYPLAIDLGLSLRMAERLAASAQRLTAASQAAALIFPVSEAAAAGFTVVESNVGERAIPAPDSVDLNALLAQVVGPFFGDIDSKAALWQRARLAPPRRAHDSLRTLSTDPSEVPNVQPMLDSFRLAYTNLHEIWSLVLPPNSLLGLKKLSLLPPSDFRMPDALWVRIVYDFVLAYRLRTINRGHLLGALTPLYLAWVASHLLLTDTANADALTPEKHIEAVAAAFETDKAYLVARWRWPDRFNP
jgi:hypothetical protein